MDVSFILIDRSPAPAQVPESIARGDGPQAAPFQAMKTVEWHVGKMEAELQQWGTRLDNLLAMADVVGTTARIDYRKRLDDLKAKYDAAEARLIELKTAGSGTWDSYKGGVETAWSELAKAFTKLAK
jgi:hypothetical protein